MSDAADVKRKLLSFIPCTPRRHKANNLEREYKRRFQERNRVPAPTSSCKNERCGLGISAPLGSIQDTCTPRSRTIHGLSAQPRSTSWHHHRHLVSRPACATQPYHHSVPNQHNDSSALSTRLSRSGLLSAFGVPIRISTSSSIATVAFRFPPDLIR
jgi:hypothetical protein